MLRFFFSIIRLSAHRQNHLTCQLPSRGAQPFMPRETMCTHKKDLHILGLYARSAIFFLTNTRSSRSLCKACTHPINKNLKVHQFWGLKRVPPPLLLRGGEGGACRGMFPLPSSHFPGSSFGFAGNSKRYPLRQAGKDSS